MRTNLLRYISYQSLNFTSHFIQSKSTWCHANEWLSGLLSIFFHWPPTFPHNARGPFRIKRACQRATIVTELPHTPLPTVSLSPLSCSLFPLRMFVSMCHIENDSKANERLTAKKFKFNEDYALDWAMICGLKHNVNKKKNGHKLFNCT